MAELNTSGLTLDQRLHVAVFVMRDAISGGLKWDGIDIGRQRNMVFLAKNLDRVAELAGNTAATDLAVFMTGAKALTSVAEHSLRFVQGRAAEGGRACRKVIDFARAHIHNLPPFPVPEQALMMDSFAQLLPVFWTNDRLGSRNLGLAILCRSRKDSSAYLRSARFLVEEVADHNAFGRPARALALGVDAIIAAGGAETNYLKRLVEFMADCLDTRPQHLDNTDATRNLLRFVGETMLTTLPAGNKARQAAEDYFDRQIRLDLQGGGPNSMLIAGYKAKWLLNLKPDQARRPYQRCLDVIAELHGISTLEIPLVKQSRRNHTVLPAQSDRNANREQYAKDLARDFRRSAARSQRLTSSLSAGQPVAPTHAFSI